MKPTTLLLAVCLALAGVRAVSAAGAAQTTFEVYPLGLADLETARAAALSIVGDEGEVIPDTANRRLLVATTAERHSRLAALFKKLEVKPRNVRIDVRFKGAGERIDSEAGVRGGGAVVVHGGDPRGTITLRPRLSHQRTTSSSDVTQSLLVLSGREASLRVGESVPYLSWLTSYGRRWGYLEREVRWHEVGASLVVQPEILGDGPSIRIRLTPELSGTVDGQPLRTRFARVATDVVVDDGQTFSLGGLDKDESFYSRFLIGAARGGETRTLDILLTPHILQPAGSR